MIERAATSHFRRYEGAEPMPKRKGTEVPSHPSMPSPRIIAIANNKGGVGKTTTAINLTGALVTHEKRVLLIDLDPQANASIGLNVLIAPTAFGTKLLLQDDRYTIAECVYEKSPFLDVIPSHRTLADTQHTLLLDPDGRTRLRTKLQTGGKPYDVILLDCPPEVGLLSQSALVAATDVLIPVDVGYFSVDGLENMLEIVERIKHSHNPSLNLFGILVTKFDARTTLAQTTIETIRKAGLPLLEPPIRICVDIIRAQMQRVPITALAPESTAAMDYAGLASYLLHPHVTKQPKVVRLRRVNGGRA